MSDDREGGGSIDASRPLSGPGGTATPFDAFDELDERLMYLPRNDIGNAERLIARHGHDLLDVDGAGWHVWDGRRWAKDGGPAEAVKRAHLTAKSARGEVAAFAADGADGGMVADFRKYVSGLGNASKINAMLQSAAPYLRVPLTDMDQEHYRLTVENGVLDLGDPLDWPEDHDPVTLLEHDRDDRATKLAPVVYDPEAQAPEFRRFLNVALPDDKVQAFVQRVFGYALVGDISEQAIVILYGGGGNGKSTFLNAVTNVLGDYHRAAAIETFLHNDRQSGSQATPDRARLYAARLVTAVEPSSGARLSENMIKTVTGGDTLTARHLHREEFEFVPSFLVAISCNNRPHIRGTDEGIWRRILMVPFKRRIADAVALDRHIDLKLRGEGSGILNWLLDGYRGWRERGLDPPPSVLAATQEYRAESDPVGEFLNDWTIPQPNSWVVAADLYEAYVRWCRREGIEPFKPAGFGRIAGQKVEREKRGSMRYLGITLHADAHPMPPEPGEGME